MHITQVEKVYISTQEGENVSPMCKGGVKL